MATGKQAFGFLDQVSDYLEKIKFAGMNAGEMLIGFFSGVGGAAMTTAALEYIAPSFVAGPVGGVTALLAGAWLGTEIAQAAKVDLAQKDPYKYFAASALLMFLAALFLPSAMFAVTGPATAKALQTVSLLVHP